MKKTLTALLLVLALLPGTVLPAQAAGSGYSDVPEGHWAAESIRRATELGLFNGVGGGKFGLGQPITRAAFVTALSRLFDWEAEGSSPELADVPDGAWYAAAVQAAYAGEVFVVTDGKFRPEDPITREEMAVMLIRSLGYAALAGAVTRYGSPFSDVIVNRGFIAIANDLGLMTGVGGGRFDPDGAAPREVAATVLVRLYDRLHAQSRKLASAKGYVPITVDTPQASLDTPLPTTPLEPLEALYDALRAAKLAGTDLSQAALRLTAGGVRTVVANGQLAGTSVLTADEVKELLAQPGVRTYYNSHYESAYCIYAPNSYQNAAVWYQDQRSMEAKLQLARLFGVTAYYME